MPPGRGGVAHAYWCAINDEPPTLQDTSDCNCGAIPLFRTPRKQGDPVPERPDPVEYEGGGLGEAVAEVGRTVGWHLGVLYGLVFFAIGLGLGGIVLALVT